jgi:hypothetical protein
MTVQGKRVYDVQSISDLKSGEYGLYEGAWFACCPTERSQDEKSPFFHPVFCGLGKHSVVEHEDGTITVSPSILVTRRVDEPQLYHGFLERGVWRSV